jgi:DNA polymerase type B, organellar and viral
LLITCPPDPPDARGGHNRLPRPLTNGQRNKRHRSKQSEMRRRCIAILDMETDPFDQDTPIAELRHKKREPIFPFLAILYSDQFEPIIIWNENYDQFCDAVIHAIEALPDRYTVYAHNGGKFDFLFLIHKLRGDVKFKGRGIMCARVGAHELRDSYHIIPEKLAAYQKDRFDYSLLKRGRRPANRAAIIQYCLADCRYTFDIVKTFVQTFGLKISIGQAAMAKIKEHYTFENFGAGWDKYVREWYFGGRVECIKGAGEFHGDYKLIDVNSLYPDAMARYSHPIGGFHDYTIRCGPPSNDTIFIELYCRNRGALLARSESGETVSTVTTGVFKTTIWEYEVALKHGLISDIEIIQCLDCSKRTDFKKFVLPLYDNRLQTKATLSELRKLGLDSGAAFMDCKKDDIFYKLLLNNGYGKFCQDPTRYKEHYLTDAGASPPDEWMRSIYDLGYPECEPWLQPIFERHDYWIWAKPSPGFRYNNVGTGASITGAARAILLDALQKVQNPIYCDTDSIICTGWDERQLHIHPTELGAWDLEDEFSKVLINGKKLYSVWHKKPKNRSAEELARGMSPDYTIKSKGTAGMTWQDMLALLTDDCSIAMPNRAPTLTKTGRQNYITRNIRRTTRRMIDAHPECVAGTSL